MQLSSFWFTEEDGFFEVPFDEPLELDVLFDDDLEELDLVPVDFDVEDFDAVDLLVVELGVVVLEELALLLEAAADEELEWSASDSFWITSTVSPFSFS